MEGIRVVSLFDGMGCCRIALWKLGIKVAKYWACEIDKYAMHEAQRNYPDTIQLGDVVKFRRYLCAKPEVRKRLAKQTILTKASRKLLEEVNEIVSKPIHLLAGGSPCQGFSFAGKGLNFKDSSSMLFFEFVKIKEELQRLNPAMRFLLENVPMKKEHEVVITRMMKVNPVTISAALVSAQNRVRLYWTNINEKPVGLFGDMEADIPQPKDKGIFLKHILETDVDERFYLSKKRVETMLKSKRSVPYVNNDLQKFNTLLAVYHKIPTDGQYVECDNVIEENNEFGCIKFGRTDEAKKLRKQNMAKGKDYTPFQAKEITGVDYEKMNTVTAATTKDNLLISIDNGQLTIDNESNSSNKLIIDNETQISMYQRPHGHNEGGEKAKDGKTPPLTKSSWEHNNLLVETENLTARQQANLKSGDEKANTLLSTSWKGSQANGMTLVRQINPSRASNGRQPYQQDRIYDTDGKSPALNAQLSDGSNAILEPTTENELPENIFDDYNGKFRTDGKSGTLTQNTGSPALRNGQKLITKTKVRRLTPTECERLQQVPDGYTAGVSDTQRYRMLGNGWPVDVIVHIFSFARFELLCS